MTITLNDREIQIPDSWNDMPLRQAMLCYQVLMTDAAGIFQPQELLPAKRMQLAPVLLGIDEAFLQRWEADCTQTYGPGDGQLIFLSELDEVLRNCTDFLFERLPPPAGDDDAPITYQLNLGLTRCPWPVLERVKKGGKKKVYLAPADALENVTIYELGICFHLFEKFIQTKQEAFVDELIATLYRPPKPRTPDNKRSGYEGDRRLPLLRHESMVKKRNPHMAILPKPVKHLLVFWFASCRQAIIRAFENVFRTDPQVGERVGNDYGWGGVLISMAEGIVHLDEVAQQPYANALTYLSYLEDERKRVEMEMAERRVR